MEEDTHGFRVVKNHMKCCWKKNVLLLTCVKASRMKRH